MKKILLIAGLLVSMNGMAQDSAIVLSKVVDIPNTSKVEIYERARLWSIDAFKIVEGSMQAQDKESGLMAFTGSFSVPLKMYRKNRDSVIYGSNDYRIKLKVQTKDNKYRYEISDIEFDTGTQAFGWVTLTSGTKCPYKYSFSSQQKGDNEWMVSKEGAINFLNNLMQSLNTYVVTKKTDW